MPGAGLEVHGLGFGVVGVSGIRLLAQCRFKALHGDLAFSLGFIVECVGCMGAQQPQPP